MSRASAGRPAVHARDHLLEMLRPVVEAAGYELEDVSVSSAGRRSLIRVTVDSPGSEDGGAREVAAGGGGIDLDGVAVVARAVSDALDRTGLGDSPADRPADGGTFAGPYVLEVSSPGVDRPLTEPRHWRRATGRLVQVPVGEQTLTGRIREVTSTGVSLDVDGRRREIGWPELGRGHVQVEFSRAAAADPAQEEHAQEDSL